MSRKTKNREFDIVVIGGGSAGCVVAHDLCRRTSRHVALLEAGPDYGQLSEGRWPRALLDARQIPSGHDWGYDEPRAKVIGGCSAHNECAALWGLPRDYDGWAEAGNPGWSYRELTPLINEIERATPATLYRGRNGILPTRVYDEGELAFWHHTFLESAQAAGFARVEDLSAPEPAEGVAPFHANVQNGIRWNASIAFLDPVRSSSNLTILDKTTTDQFVIERGKVIELICQSRGDTISLRADRFVLCAGTYGSPMILLRSGIGPWAHLRSLNISVALDLPGVGENLHDHSGTSIAFQLTRRAAHALDQDAQQGRLYESQVILRAASRYCEAGFDLHIVPYLTRGEGRAYNCEMLIFNMVPRARGKLRLMTRALRRHPFINPNFFGDAEQRDLAIVLEGLELARSIAKHEPLASAIQRESNPGTRRRANALASYVRAQATGYPHPVGTCKMGPAADSMAVVDHHGRVHGLENVYVADASIMPRSPRANINLTCMLIARGIAA